MWWFLSTYNKMDVGCYVRGVFVFLVTVQRCNAYIDHLYKVVLEVVKRGGEGAGV